MVSRLPGEHVGHSPGPAHVATKYSYDETMEVGIRDARAKPFEAGRLSLSGEKIYLTIRGERVAEIIPASTRGSWRRA